jgi:hypothetical protein
MKHGQEAQAQYSELAAALGQMDAGWIVSEVEEVISRGKTVLFRDLSPDEHALYESRLTEEIDRGAAVAPARPNDNIGVPYEPHERLALLVEASERVIAAGELSRFYISRFAAEQGIIAIDLESPEDLSTLASDLVARSIPLEAPRLTNERLSILRHTLHDEVLS